MVAWLLTKGLLRRWKSDSPTLDTSLPRDERCITFADHGRAMEAVDRQLSRWGNLLDRLAEE